MNHSPCSGLSSQPDCGLGCWRAGIWKTGLSVTPGAGAIVPGRAAGPPALLPVKAGMRLVGGVAGSCADAVFTVAANANPKMIRRIFRHLPVQVEFTRPA